MKVLPLFAAWILPVYGALSLPASPARAEESFTLEPLKAPPPESVAAPLRKTLAPEGYRVTGANKRPFFDIWFRKPLPTQPAKPELGIDFSEIPEGGLVAVIKLHRQAKDFKGKAIRPGTYTMRRGILPQDGDHLGVSDTRDFLLLSPVDADTKLDPMPTSELVKLSVKASRTKHPSILWLTKVFDEAEKLPRVFYDESYGYWILDVKLECTGARKEPLRLGIIFVGESPSL